MLKKFEETMRKFETSQDAEEKNILQRQIQYYYAMSNDSLKRFISGLSEAELEELNNKYGLTNDPKEIKRALLERVCCYTDHTQDIYNIKRRVNITKQIVALIRKHNLNIVDNDSFINMLSLFIHKINNYNLREIPQYLAYEQIDYVTNAIWWQELSTLKRANSTFTKSIKEQYGTKCVEAEKKSATALIKFFKDKLNRFELELFILLLNNHALKPDNTKGIGQFTYRLKNMNFNDQYINTDEEDTICMADIINSLELTGENNELKR